MKKILLMCFLILSFNAVSFASILDPDEKPTPYIKTVGIFLDAPMSYVDNETVRTLIPEKAKELFPRLKFDLLPFDKTEMALRTYREDHRMIVNQYFSQPLNRNDIQAIGKDLSCDYALFIKISNGPPRVSSGLLSTTFKTTVICDVRLLDIATGNYIISKQIVKDGKSTAIYAGVPSFDKAYNEALEKTLKELTIDTSTL
ncbi:MAG: hypothetical protein H6Q73_938 [Firmicutes bacterium]|nr:hypothetical protein [Bacillota bacterium]